jgi:hypothetical protein
LTTQVSESDPAYAALGNVSSATVKTEESYSLSGLQLEFDYNYFNYKKWRFFYHGWFAYFMAATYEYDVIGQHGEGGDGSAYEFGLSWQPRYAINEKVQIGFPLSVSSTYVHAAKSSVTYVPIEAYSSVYDLTVPHFDVGLSIHSYLNEYFDAVGVLRYQLLDLFPQVGYALISGDPEVDETGYWSVQAGLKFKF